VVQFHAVHGREALKDACDRNTKLIEPGGRLWLSSLVHKFGNVFI
jgi:hypothetical protein